jgi:hypothetical protein
MNIFTFTSTSCKPWYLGIATAYGLNDRCSIPCVVSRCFSTKYRPAVGHIQAPIQWVPGARYPGLKQPRRDGDHSTPTSAEVKNSGAASPLPHTFL